MPDIPSDVQILIGRLGELCADVWAGHRDPKSPDYNDCESAECVWCQETREAVEAIATLSQQRYRMDVEIVHHAMSSSCGDPEVVPVEDPNGQWIKA